MNHALDPVHACSIDASHPWVPSESTDRNTIDGLQSIGLTRQDAKVASREATVQLGQKGAAHEARGSSDQNGVVLWQCSDVHPNNRRA